MMKNISFIENNITLAIVDDITREISSALGDELKEIVLYGSCARNQQDKDSDIDIVVFVDNSVKNMAETRKKISGIKVDLSLKYDVVISIIIKDYRQYLSHREMIPFYSTIYNEGVALYG